MKAWKQVCIIITREEFFNMEATLVACKDVDGLFKVLNMSHCSNEWRLFIQSSKVSLKTVLLHNGNVLPSIPVAHAFGNKEVMIAWSSYCNTLSMTHTNGTFVQTWNSLTFAWTAAWVHQIFLFPVWVGQQRQGTSLCQKDMAYQKYFGTRTQKCKTSFTGWVIEEFVAHLLIKLGLMKNFVKAMDRNGTTFLYLQQKFLPLSDTKIRECVFTGPDIRSFLCDEVFERVITGDEQRAWHAFWEVITGFLGNRRADNYKDLVE